MAEPGGGTASVFVVEGAMLGGAEFGVGRGARGVLLLLFVVRLSILPGVVESPLGDIYCLLRVLSKRDGEPSLVAQESMCVCWGGGGYILFIQRR